MTNEDRARAALTEVFVGDHSRLADHYAPGFVDHVNRMEFRGVHGIGQSTALPRRLLSDLQLEIERLVSAGDWVALQWVLSGTNRGREVRLTGVSFLRFEGGLIAESWDTADSIETFRQLGIWRSILVMVTEWRLLLGLLRAEKIPDPAT